ncbi:MAG: hypothetical protein AAF927_15805 [Bacteroidota bacterium]
MTKSISFLALSMVLLLVACGPEEIPIPYNPMAAQASPNQNTLLHPQYEGNEIVARLNGSMRCRNKGTVEYVSDGEGCRYLIADDNGRIFNPVNYNRIAVKMRQGMEIMFDYETIRGNATECTLGEAVKITCISEIRARKKRLK